MRRADREIKDLETIKEILDTNFVCRVAMQDDKGLYLVPLNYGYEFKENKLTLYFHGAKVGRKVNTFEKGTCEVAFEIDGKHTLSGSGDNACVYTYFYESIIGNGIASVIKDPKEKLQALKSIMFNLTKKDDFKYGDKSIENVLAMKIEVSTFSAKKH